jgi:hypothetical protein
MEYQWYLGGAQGVTKEFEERLQTVFKDYKTTDGKATIAEVKATGDVLFYLLAD